MPAGVRCAAPVAKTVYIAMRDLSTDEAAALVGGHCAGLSQR
jgi:hypothetical protein